MRGGGLLVKAYWYAGRASRAPPSWTKGGFVSGDAQRPLSEEGTPDSDVPIRGSYDYSVFTAEFGSSHAAGVDCGVSGSGAAQIGPTRGWEVLLHEWNHEFDWVCICGEQVPGYPVTHDSDGCGKQPIVNMGCGQHRQA